MSALIECVPNFSEARRPEVVRAIVEAITAGTGVRVLDVSSDLDHNRTVVTCVGTAANLAVGAFAGIATAAALIDLDQHTGVHPRLGATDVVPFVPLRQASMEDCVALARQLGERVGRELDLPVYLYEAAATRPDRRNLETIRRGEYEGLKAEIATRPERYPDFGPRRLGPAGATVIGARPFLIAYNVYLSTTDVRIAQQVARAVRHSSGGLRYVKALGLLVGGQAQVSMNLTDFRRTPVPRVLEMVRREAARYGASIVRSELVGMIPQAALVETAKWYVQLDGFKDEQILEQRLATLEAVSPAVPPTAGLLADLMAESAAVDSSAAAAHTGAIAAALVARVAALSLASGTTADMATALQDTRTTAQQLHTALSARVAQASAAGLVLRPACRLPDDTAEAGTVRTTAMAPALHEVVAVLLRIAQEVLQVLRLALHLAACEASHSLADTGAAAHLALAAVRTAAQCVQAHAAAMADRQAAHRWQDDVAGLEREAARLADTVQRHLYERQQTAPPAVH
ncbi:MAG: glutamate formimidoyltransferase [Candidatus Tectimicrobiota bacterium]